MSVNRVFRTFLVSVALTLLPPDTVVWRIMGPKSPNATWHFTPPKLAASLIHALLHLVGTDLHYLFLQGVNTLFFLQFLEAMSSNIIADRVRIIRCQVGR